MDPFIVTIVVLAVVGITLIAPIFTCSIRANEEVSLKPLWQKRCAGKMGAFAIGIPAIRVALYQDFMVVAFLGQTVIPYRDIAEVTEKRSFWSLGLSGVALKLRGMSAGYFFKLSSRDSTEFKKAIESHLSHNR